jgi:hypothetical protein
MKDRHDLMPILRLAYTTQFLIALIAIFVLWSQVGGQSHLDLLPWSIKLGLGLAVACGVVRATAASVAGERAFNGLTVRWLAFTLVALLACGYASYYAHVNFEEEDEGDQQQDTTVSSYHASSCPMSKLREVGKRAPAGTFGADFGDHNPVAVMQEAL